MTSERCENIRLLLQADADGELEAAGAAEVAAHLARCPDCAAAQAAIATLSARLGSELPYHAAPDRLRQTVRSTVESFFPAPTPAPITRAPRPEPPRHVAWWRRGWIGWMPPFGAGLAVAAAIALAVLPSPGGGGVKNLADGVVADHIRALQPGHLMDVVSTDQHTVKPWFDGKLDYAPPVKDLAALGFPLIGGRLDYLAGRPVAALAYRHGQHILDFYAWPAAGRSDAPPDGGARDGYNFLHWTQDGMTFWAVSDVDTRALADFVRLWRAAP
jgi:anti-sigma factor RsiW